MTKTPPRSSPGGSEPEDQGNIAEGNKGETPEEAGKGNGILGWVIAGGIALSIALILALAAGAVVVIILLIKKKARSTP